VGAAVACPQRPVLALVGDGASMYTVQALWTMAREKLHVITIVFNNASYSVLNIELERVGADEVGPKARAQLDLAGPVLNFSQLGRRAWACRLCGPTTAGEFVRALEQALATPGPHLIEAMVPQSLSGPQAPRAAQVAALARPACRQPVARFAQAQDRALKLAGAATAGRWTCGAPQGNLRAMTDHPPTLADLAEGPCADRVPETLRLHGRGLRAGQLHAARAL
jgi:TPP-dependent trihydroxycyclohexane-1,2-dione (THcHDO) dehydratase